MGNITIEKDYKLLNENSFPINMTIEECREAIKGVSGFRESNRGENTIVFNYDSISDESFPNPLEYLEDPKKSYFLKIRRECRGLIFCGVTGKLLCRKLHKFFNINEFRECKAELIDLNQPYILMDKIDGSLISPLILNGKEDQVYWGSKQGVSDLGTMLNEFISRIESDKDNNIGYNEFSKKWLKKGYSPLFEFASPNQKIIIHYKEESLKLLALRNIETGLYLKWNDLNDAANEFNIPLVNLIDTKTNPIFSNITNTSKLVEIIKNQKYIEGCVLKFEESGLMYKIKTNQYIDLSRLQLRSPKEIKNEKDVWSLLLSGHYDDVKDTINFITGDDGNSTNDTGIINNNDDQSKLKIDRIKSFSKELFDRIDKVSIEIIQSIINAKKQGLEKKLYHQYESKSGLTKKAFTFSYSFFEKINENDTIQQHLSIISKQLIDKLKLSTSSNSKLEEGRQILGKDIKF